MVFDSACAVQPYEYPLLDTASRHGLHFWTTALSDLEAQIQLNKAENADPSSGADTRH